MAQDNNGNAPWALAWDVILANGAEAPAAPEPDPQDIDEDDIDEEADPYNQSDTDDDDDDDEADDEEEHEGEVEYWPHLVGGEDAPSVHQHHFSLTPKGKKLQSGLGRLQSLVDLSAGAWLKSIHNFDVYEHELNFCVPHTLYPRLLSTAMTLKKFRPLIIRKIIKCWPSKSLGIGSTDNETFDSEQDALNFEMGGSLEYEEYRFSKRIISLVEAFIHSLAHGGNRTLKMLKLHATPECDNYYTLLRKTLKRYKSLLKDLEKVDPEFGIEAILDMTSASDRQFWFDFLRKVRKFVRVVGLTLKSPFMTSDRFDIIRVLNLINMTNLKSLDIQNERLFNHESNANRDGVEDFISRLYGPNHHHHPWLFMVKEGRNLQTLSLWYSTKVPGNERNGFSFDVIDREVREPSPCAISSWKSVLKNLPLLRTLYLGGNCVTNCLESLLGPAPFRLTSLNVEGSRLSEKDYRYLAGSKSIQTINDISLGDFDLGLKFDSIMAVLRNLDKIESLDLCMDGYERYLNNESLNDRQMIEIMSFLRDFHHRHLKFVSFGGHKISEAAIVSIAQILVPLPKIMDFILPIDGMSPATRSWFSTNVKLPYASGMYPDDMLEDKNPEDIKRVIKAVDVEVRRAKRPMWRFSSKNIRDGIRITL